MSTFRFVIVLALALATGAPLRAAGPLCRARAPELFAHPVRSHVSRAGMAPAARAVRDVTVGQQRAFWAWDFSVMPPGFRTVKATCRAVGERGLVYVEDAEWGTRFTEADLARIVERFERSSPAGALDPARGIGELVARTFAPAPAGLDGDPRVILLFTAMASFNGSSFDGYFNAFDTLPESEAMAQYEQHSNECEVLYLNTRGSPVSSEYMLGVLAHELAHLVCNPFDGEEVSWLDESLGEASMVACGYPTDVKHLERFAQKPETPLITDKYVSYGACFLFGTYLLEQLGPQAIGQIVRDAAHGEQGLEATLAAHGRAPFASFHRDWVVANLVAHTAPEEPRFAYRAFPVPRLNIRAVDALPAEDSGELAAHRVRYLRLPAAASPTDVSMVIEPSEATARLMSVSWNGPAVEVGELLTAGGDAVLSPAAGEQVLVLVGDAKAGYRLQLSPAAARR